MAADLSDYINLTVYDRDPPELIARALVDAAQKLPGWVPREGNTEVVLIESMALQVAELVYAINRVPAAIVEALLRIYGVTRDPGAPPTTTVRFDFLDSLGHTIDAGTRVRYNPGDPDDVVVFAADTNATAAPGVSFVEVAATGTRNTTVANGTIAGTVLDVIDSVVAVDEATLADPIGAGRDPEDTATWLNRGVQRLARLNSALVLPLHFVARALEEPGVVRAQALDRYNPAVGPVGSNNGHITVAVMGDAGVALSGGAKTALQDAMSLLASAHLVVHVIDATVNTVNVTATVARIEGYTASEVQANVVAALKAYLDPNVWAWGATVWRNELISVMDRAAGVDRVVSVTTPATDLALTGVAPLAKWGTLAVTVT